MIKNYTSEVPVERTISRIEQALARAGASSILKEYAEGQLAALSFQVVMARGKRLSFRLPADGEAIYRVLYSRYTRPGKATAAKVRQQAARTAWKLMQDWVEVQLSLIEMQQADFLQVFLPYVWDGRQSFYHALKSKDFLALPEASS